MTKLSLGEQRKPFMLELHQQVGEDTSKAVAAVDVARLAGLGLDNDEVTALVTHLKERGWITFHKTGHICITNAGYHEVENMKAAQKIPPWARLVGKVLFWAGTLAVAGLITAAIGRLFK